MRVRLVLLGAVALGTAAAAKPPPPPNVIGDDVRANGQLRDVIVQEPARLIAATVEVGRVASDAGGGGAIGGLIIAEHDNKREVMTAHLQERAELLAAPLRSALANVDAAALANETTRKAIAAVPWIHPGDFLALAARSPDGTEGEMPAVDTPQVILVIYGYECSPDFTQIRVSADVLLKRSTTVANMAPLYRQRVISVVELRDRSYDAEANVRNWSSGDGEKARSALRQGFAAVEALIPQALAMTASDLSKLDAKATRKVFAAGFYGSPVAEVLPGSTALWARGMLVQVTTADR